MKTYDPANVFVAVDGIPIGGYQDGDAITVAFDNDAYAKVVGADGEVARSKRNDSTGKITLNLLYSSSSNAALRAILARQRTNEDVVGITIVDGQGGYEVDAPQCWIVKAPDATFGTEMGTLEWVFDTGQMDPIYSGINDEAG